MTTTTSGHDPAPPLDSQARFDPSLGAWVLSRHADVASALGDARLVGGGELGDGHDAHLAVRVAARDALSPERMAVWRAELESSARRFATNLPLGEMVDLVGSFAEPWSLSVALTAAGAPVDDAPRLARLARDVFLAAAHATDSDVTPRAQLASSELARALHGVVERARVDVQAFVALSQTLPCTLAAVWLTLFQHSTAAADVRARRELVPRAIEELLRLAGPSQAVFRRARAEVTIDCARIGAGDRVVLLLSAANHDAARFSQPEQLDFNRETASHLAFGRGPHSCSGASLIRMAIATATDALLDAVIVESIGDVEWIDGFAIRGPATLPVVLRRGERSA